MLDKPRHLLFSLNALDEIQDRFGGFDNLDQVMMGKDSIKNLRWLLALLINEGKDDGEEDLSEKQIGRLFHAGNIDGIKTAIFQAFSMGSRGTTEPMETESGDEEDEEEKNAAAGRGN